MLATCRESSRKIDFLLYICIPAARRHKQTFCRATTLVYYYYYYSRTRAFIPAHIYNILLHNPTPNQTKLLRHRDHVRSKRPALVNLYSKPNTTMSKNCCDDSGSNARSIQVDSPNVQYCKEYIQSTVDYPVNYAVDQGNTIVVNFFNRFISLKNKIVLIHHI